MTQDRCLERERERDRESNDSCHFSDQHFLPCFLCKHTTILFQTKNGNFNIKLRLLFREI